MVDHYDDKNEKPQKITERLRNIGKIPGKKIAAAIRDATRGKDIPEITASGRGTVADKILELAYENDIKVRQDSALAEILVQFDQDSPIPSEAFFAVAEILYYVYRANGEPNPFDAAFKHAIEDETPP